MRECISSGMHACQGMSQISCTVLRFWVAFLARCSTPRCSTPRCVQNFYIATCENRMCSLYHQQRGCETDTHVNACCKASRSLSYAARPGLRSNQPSQQGQLCCQTSMSSVSKGVDVAVKWLIACVELSCMALSVLGVANYACD